MLILIRKINDVGMFKYRFYKSRHEHTEFNVQNKQNIIGNITQHVHNDIIVLLNAHELSIFYSLKSWAVL